jgi:hypothetical protein
MTGNGTPGPRDVRGGQLAGTLSRAGLGLTLVVVMAIGLFVMLQALPFGPGAKPSPSGTPSPSTQGSPPGTPPPASGPLQSSAATAQPSPVLRGVLPGPDATIPPIAPAIIPGLGIEALAAAAEAEGLTCESDAGAYGEVAEGYNLGCDGEDASGHAKVALSVTYWTLDAVSDIRLSIVSDAPGIAVGPSVPIRLLPRIGGLSAGEIAKAWVQGHLDDQACRPRCTSSYGTVHLELHVGENGARALYVSGYGT